MQRSLWLSFFGVMIAAQCVTGTAYAQTNIACGEAERPSFGAAVGRSSPYFDLDREAVAGQSGSILVGGGPQLSAWGDMSIAGPLRFRVEGSTTRWNVERRIYSPPSYQVTETDSVGSISAQHVGVAVGLRGGRSPVCAHVLAGGGLYSLTFRETTLRRPGVSLAAGIEVPTSERGRVHVDVQLHVIDTQGRHPVSSSQALAAALLAGWAYRF